MKYRFTIPGYLPSLNDLLAAERTTRRGGRGHSPGNKMKQQCELIICSAVKKWIPKARPKPPVILHYTYYEKNRKRDLDNVSAVAHKFTQDALVKAGVLENDGWKYIQGFDDTFFVDAKKPRIEVEIEEL